MTLDDLERLKLGILVIFSRFQVATHISRVNCSDTTGDGLRQPSHEMFSIKLRLDINGVRFDPLVVLVHEIWVLLSKRAISATVD